MKLTNTETKLLAQLRKRETTMFRYRYWYLVVGIFSYLVVGYGYFLLQNLPEKDFQIKLVLNTYILPCLFLIGAQGSFLIGTAIRDWNGNAIRVLLLKLVDERAENE